MPHEWARDHEVLHLEGKFGQGKRLFSIGRLIAKLVSTSETAIALCFLVMNLERWPVAIFPCLYVREQKLRLQNTGISYCLRALHGTWAPIPIS